jgi:hypothetical protein
MPSIQPKGMLMFSFSDQIIYLFVACLTTLSVTRLYTANWMADGAWRFEKDLEGSGCGIIEKLTRNLPEE